MRDWKTVRLGDVCEIVNGFAFDSKLFNTDKKGIPLIRIRDVIRGFSETYTTENADSRFLVKVGDLLIGMDGEFNCSLWKSEDSFLNQRVCKIVPNLELINKDYVYYGLKGKLKEIEDKTSFVTVKHISSKQIENIVLKYPPLETQQQIVVQLDKCTALIANQKQILEKYDTLIKSRFIEMTENSETELIRMGDIASYINGYAFKPEDWSNTGKKKIRIQNLNDKKAIYNHFEGNLDKKFLVRKNDVLISWATHLEAYIWDEEDAWLNQHIFKVVFDKRQVNKIYFVYSTEDALKIAFRNAHGFKPTMEHIKRADFENAEVKLPSLAVQEQFATFVQQIDKSKFEYTYTGVAA